MLAEITASGPQRNNGKQGRTASIRLRSPPIAVFLEGIEEPLQQWVVDGTAAAVGVDVPLRDIGLVLRPMDEYPVPGFVLRRTRPRYAIVPLFTAAEFRIDIHDHAAVMEQPMPDDIPHSELGAVRSHHSLHPQPTKIGLAVVVDQHEGKQHGQVLDRVAEGAAR